MHDLDSIDFQFHYFVLLFRHFDIRYLIKGFSERLPNMSSHTPDMNKWKIGEFSLKKQSGSVIAMSVKVVVLTKNNISDWKAYYALCLDKSKSKGLEPKKTL